MYGFYGLKHHTVEMLPCGTDGRTDGQQTREDKATQRLDAGRLSFAIGTAGWEHATAKLVPNLPRGKFASEISLITPWSALLVPV